MRVFRSLLLLVALAALFAPAGALAQDTTGVGSIGGTVVTASQQPAPDVAVCVQGTDRCAVTDAAGSFTISDLRASQYIVEITAPGAPPIVSDPIEVRPGLTARVEVTLPEIADLQQSLTVTVSAPAFVAPQEVKTSSFLIGGRDIDTGAGALQDVSRYVQALPGVVIGNNDFRNDIIVRGGSPLENLFVVDNVEVPNINTFANFASAGGTVSILDATLVQDVTFLTGGYPAPYINRASSVLQISQREGDRQQFRGAATVGFAGAGAVLEGPVNDGKGSWVVSARRSFLDLFTDDIGIGGVPVTYTFNGKFVYDVSPRDRVWLVNISANDTIRLGATNEEIDPESELSNLDIRYDGWRTATGFNWQRLFGSRGVGLLGVTWSKAEVNQTTKDLIRDGIPPPDADIDEVIENAPVVFSEDSGESETTIKYDLTTYVGRLGKLQVGGSVKLFGIDYDAVQPFGNDSPYSPVPGLNEFDLQQSFTSTQTGAYVQGTTDVTKAFNVTWGARVDNYAYLEETRVSPRLGASYALTDRLSLRGSFGIYYQQPAFLFLSSFPENRDLLPFRADHYVAGVTYQLGDSTRLSVEGYRKNYTDYPVATQFPTLSLANVGDTFVVQDLLFPMTSAGEGESTGVELFIERKFSDNWYGQANLAFSETRHAGLDGVLRPGSFDYPVVANLVGGYRFNPRWELSTRVSYLAGRPYTPYDPVLSTEQSRGIYDLSRVNAERLPDYFRMDIRIDRRFTVGGEPLIVFAGAQNVTNRQNIAGYSWSRRTNVVVEQEQQGLFPILGVEWRF